MERIEVNVETGEVKVIQYTAEEEAAALAYAASLLAPVEPEAPTIIELPVPLEELSVQIDTLEDTNVNTQIN